MPAANIPPERTSMRVQFDRICGAHGTWAGIKDEDRSTLIRRMERNCFEVTIESCRQDGIDRLFREKKFVNRYSMICGRVLANLDPAGPVTDTNLLDRILSGEIDPYHVAEMSSFELCPQSSKQERHDIHTRQKQKAKKKYSRAHICCKCGGNKTSVREGQTRASDEASTHSIKCKNCSHVWHR